MRIIVKTHLLKSLKKINKINLNYIRRSSSVKIIAWYEENMRTNSTILKT